MFGFDFVAYVVALELFTQGETISDVDCDDCHTKVNTLKRCVVKVLLVMIALTLMREVLPPVLIIHLKRFELDFETMALQKLNNYFSFPFDLNMEPYTVQVAI